ncbi:MAG: serine--tRNA ligase [Patescibacteria group bacterium]|nr:serine--tRNA ligase [Patescibacteria group bacterium]
MIDIKFLRDNPKIVKESLKNRSVDLDINKLLKLDEKKRAMIKIVESLRSQRNEISAQKGKPTHLKKAKEIKKELKDREEELETIEKEFNSIFMLIPNILLKDVPVGKSEEDNKVIRKWGKPKKFNFEIKDHLELGKALDLIDIERAVKISGSRFGILKNQAVLLELALIQFAFDVFLKEGFSLVVPPTLLKSEMMKGMGYIDTKEDREERYFLEKDDLYLAGTGEQMIGPMHEGETFLSKDLPKRYVAFSSCFREEAGSYGKDTKGIFRVHQFDKIEMFSFAKPEDSEKEHLYLLSLQEKLMQGLEIPYRVVHLCGGDTCRASASTFDIESWIPSQNKFRETHSTSNCTDFQARRLKIKYKDGDKTNFVHTLNATAFAIGRTLIATLENYQQKDGSILIPKALKKYLSFNHIK